MKLKPTIKGMKSLEVHKEEPKKKKTENKLPPDTYKPMFPPMRFLVREMHSHKDASLVKQYLELSVKRFDNDEENAPTVYMQMYQESDFYTGYLKGKTVSFPLEMLYTVMEQLEELSDECDKRKIF